MATDKAEEVTVADSVAADSAAVDLAADSVAADSNIYAYTILNIMLLHMV